MKYIYVLTLFMLTSACTFDEFLDVSPNINTATTIKGVDDLDAIYNYNVIEEFTDYVNFFATDNAYLPQNLVDRNIFKNEIKGQYAFATEIDRTSDGTWSALYNNVRNPILFLELIEKGELVGAGSELETIIKAESHFLRAYYFFELSVLYAKHYNSTTENEPGIVLKQTSSYEENQKRATLKETFDFILADLEEALKFPESAPKQSLFRIDKSAVHALAARIYLYIGDYANAETHANAALTRFSGVYNMMDLTFETSAWYWSDGDLANTVDEYWEFPTVVGDQYFYIRRSNPSWNISPSQELLDLYDSKDLRFRFYVKNWFKRKGVPAGEENDQWWSYLPQEVGYVFAGQGVPEMYFTRAECKARNNDYAGAMADIEMVRINRFAPEDYTPLAVPSSAKATVELIIEERRREDPFEYRFMDIKRLNNDPLTNPIIITRTIDGETITIPANDNRYARPIGTEVINLSYGETVQNEY